ncbi:MAG TPA: nucleoside hydrolase [Lunatimonas sp.]|nr:nucleoside hydrolase [Lunatimonas sp.]
MKHYALSFLLIFIGYTSIFSQTINVILDTDIDSDVDDVGALAMLHTLADHGKVEILGVIVTSDDQYAPACTDAINHFFNRPEIPIGVEKGIPLQHISKYTKEIAEGFPKRIQTYEEALDATTLYRQLLSDSDDQSVVLISIGHLTNLAHLLKSEPDDISPLNGIDLVRKKVKLWSCMGGMYPEGKEANFYRPDPASTVYSVKNWPGEVVFGGWELGGEIITGGLFLQKYLDPTNPVFQAYKLYNNFSGRQSWDQASILYAVSPDKGYWELVREGHCQVQPDGSNTWIPGKPGKQAYLKKKADPREVAKIIDALMVGIYSPTF